MTQSDTPSPEAERLVVQWAVKLIEARHSDARSDWAKVDRSTLAGLEEAVQQYQEPAFPAPTGPSVEDGFSDRWQGVFDQMDAAEGPDRRGNEDA